MLLSFYVQEIICFIKNPLFILRFMPNIKKIFVNKMQNPEVLIAVVRISLNTRLTK